MDCVTELIHCTSPRAHNRAPCYALLTSHIDKHSSLTSSDGDGVCLEGRRGLVLGEGGEGERDLQLGRVGDVTMH